MLPKPAMSAQKRATGDTALWSHRGSLKPARSGEKYDEDSGQVYHETRIIVSKHQGFDWIGEFKTPNLVKIPELNAGGSRSLRDSAKVIVVRHIRSLTPSHLTGIPWSIGEDIWAEIVESRRESLHAWRTFATAYPDHFKQAKYRYQIDIKSPSLPYHDYFRGVTSRELKWLTCLRISPRTTPTAELVRLAEIWNLAVLELSDDRDHVLGDAFGESRLDEALFRTWSQLAGESKAFYHLRVLLLGWQEHVSEWIFKYLDSLPSLCCIIFTDCPGIHQRNRPTWENAATCHGWVARSAKKSAKSLRPLLDDKTFYLGAVSGCYYNSMERFEELARVDKPHLTAKLPILECWLGHPRLWTHIVEEYPGSRTVWFDNVKIESEEHDGKQPLADGKARMEKEASVASAQTNSGGLPGAHYYFPTQRGAARRLDAGRDQKRRRDLQTPNHELRSPPAKRSLAHSRRNQAKAAGLEDFLTNKR